MIRATGAGAGHDGSLAVRIILFVAAPEIPNLHDAILERVTVDWPRRTARIECTRVPEGDLHIVLSGISEVRIDRRDPWGPSDSINSVYVNRSGPSGVALYIEMQSGDPILVLGDGLDVQEPAG